MWWVMKRGCEVVHRISARESFDPGGFTRSDPPCSIFGLHSDHVSRKMPMGENPAQVLTFLNRFVKAGGNYLAADF